MSFRLKRKINILGHVDRSLSSQGIILAPNKTNEKINKMSFGLYNKKKMNFLLFP